MGAARRNRLLKTIHLRRWSPWPLVAAYLKYASLALTLAALHLDLFEQPGRQGVLIIPQVREMSVIVKK